MSDVVLLSLGTTLGWRVSDSLFVDQLRARGRERGAGIGPDGRQRAAAAGLPGHRPGRGGRRAARAARRRSTATRRAPLVISTTTAAMLADTRGLPYAVRLDAPARLNRPGARNAGLHALERRALARRPAGAAVEPGGAAPRSRPGTRRRSWCPLRSSRRAIAPWRRDRSAVAYTPDVKAKGLDIVCGAWAAAGLGEARLEVFGVERERRWRT